MTDMKPQFIYDPETKCIVQIDQPTLRDQFAMAALPALISLHRADLAWGKIPAQAYALADAMLEARNARDC